MVKDDDGHYRPVRSEEIIEAALSEMKRRFCRGAKITSPEETKSFLQLKLGGLEHEVRNGPRELDSALSEIFLGFQAANPRAA